MLRLDRVILAVDDSEHYQELAQLAVDAWRERIGVQPVVGFVGRQAPPAIDGAELVSVPALPSIPTAFQAQCLRLLLPALFPADVSVLSDADMIPLAREYFDDPLRGAREGDFVVYRPFDLIPEGRGTTLHRTEIPVCYNAARGSTWGEIFGVTSVEAIGVALARWFGRFSGRMDDVWAADQRLLHEHLSAWDPGGERTVRLGDAVTGHRRLHVSDLASGCRRRGATIVLPRSVLAATDFHIETTAQRTPAQLAAALGWLGLGGRSRQSGRASVSPPCPAPGTSAAVPLVTAVANTDGPVLQLGADEEAVRLLHALCRAQGRELLTADTSRTSLERVADLAADWHRFEHVPVHAGDEGRGHPPTAWGAVGGDRSWGLVVVAHDPPERRVAEVRRLRGQANVLVVCDTEEPAFGFKAILPQFLHSYTYRRRPSWTTVVSDDVDVRSWFRATPGGSDAAVLPPPDTRVRVESRASSAARRLADAGHLVRRRAAASLAR